MFTTLREELQAWNQLLKIFSNKRKQVSKFISSSDIYLALQSACESQLTEVVWKCYPCSKSFKSMEQLDEHKKSKKHKKNEKDFKSKNPNATQSSMFENITTDKPILGSFQLEEDSKMQMENEPINTET